MFIPTTIYMCHYDTSSHFATIQTPETAVPLTLEPDVALKHARTKISDKGRLVIPAPFREALGIMPGDTVFLELVDGELRILTFEARLKRTHERMKNYAKPGISMVDELIAERRREAQKEEDGYQAWKNKNESVTSNK